MIVKARKPRAPSGAPKRRTVVTRFVPEIAREPAAVVEKEREMPIKARKPEQTVGLIHAAGTDAGIEYVKWFQVWTDDTGHEHFMPNRTIVVNGANYEHSAEDTDGVWLYRHTPR